MLVVQAESLWESLNGFPSAVGRRRGRLPTDRQSLGRALFSYRCSTPGTRKHSLRGVVVGRQNSYGSWSERGTLVAVRSHALFGPAEPSRSTSWAYVQKKASS